MIVIGIRMPEDEKEQFAVIAKEKGLTMSALARIILQKYIKEN